ncbi:MAG TPA: 3-dehydroquinate synthase [Bacteroidia bacterium]|nr:3-dehydroquinate synthase [Bacteroidia bacterium]
MENRYWAGTDALEVLSGFLDKQKDDWSSVFILCDSNTHNHCYPLIEAAGIKPDRLIIIGAGEHHKTLQTASAIWSQLLEAGADRSSMLINLGGGVVTDIGGFAAAGFMRGIRFINLPTSLLGMVDAAIGGKTGIDFGGAKNIIGSFAEPEITIAHLPFLDTLPAREWHGGYAEMIKHILLDDKQSWAELVLMMNGNPEKQTVRNFFTERIQISAATKLRIVAADPNEKGIRAILNFGHTVGHAIESWSLEQGNDPVTHGEAVAAGMVCEAFLSVKLSEFPADAMRDVANVIHGLYAPIKLNGEARGHIIEKIRFDKKAHSGTINLSLLKAPGEPVSKVPCSVPLLAESLHYYSSLT